MLWSWRPALHSSKPAAAECGGQMMGQTDRRTDGQTDVRPLRWPSYYASSVDNVQCWKCVCVCVCGLVWFGCRWRSCLCCFILMYTCGLTVVIKRICHVVLTAVCMTGLGFAANSTTLHPTSVSILVCFATNGRPNKRERERERERDTRDAILTCARKPTWIGLIYRTDFSRQMPYR